MFKKLALSLFLILSVNAYGHDSLEDAPYLTTKQEDALGTFLTGIYVMNALEGPFPPYICMFSVFWEDYYYPVEKGIRHYLAHMPRQEQKRIPPTLIMWWTTLAQLGCGDYDPLRDYHD